MKKKLTIFLVLLCLTVCAVHWLGIGYYTSGSAVADLRAELESIYGLEYNGKPTENGTEDMIFVVKPKTCFLTNWNLRYALSLDYEYACSVVFTTRIDGQPVSVRTITYQALDPMGADHAYDRAHLELSSMTETTERP